MTKKNQDDDPVGGEELLTAIVKQAIDGGADAVELEYDSAGHLEVMFMAGNSGAGSVITESERKRALVDALWKNAKLRGRSRGGTLTVAVDGQDHKVKVEICESFGELAYRLKFKKGH
jgi:hypothetical protein